MPEYNNWGGSRMNAGAKKKANKKPVTSLCIHNEHKAAICKKYGTKSLSKAMTKLGEEILSINSK